MIFEPAKTKLSMISRNVFPLTVLSALFLLFAVVPDALMGQGRAPVTNSVIQDLQSLNGNYQRFLYNSTAKAPTAELRGSNYIHEDWVPAVLLLAGDTIMVPDVKVRIDATNHVVEVEQNGTVRVFPPFLVNSIIIEGSNEVYSPRKFVGEDIPAGFYQVLYDGESALYVHYSTHIKQANYNVALDAGRTWDEILLMKEYYVRVDGKLEKLEKKKAKRLDQLGGGEIEDWISEQDVDIRSDEGLISVLKHLDEGRQ